MPPRELPTILGRNGWDDAYTGPDALAAEIINFDLYRGLSTRGGCINYQLLGGDPFGGITIDKAHMILYVVPPGAAGYPANRGYIMFVLPGPTAGTDRIVALWGDKSNYFRYVAISNFVDDPARANASFANLNKKVFLAGHTSLNRLQVIQGGFITDIRPGGLSTPAAPTAADSAVAGTYPAVPRTYRVAWTDVNASGRAVRRSLLGAASPIGSPAGVFDAVVVTRPTAPGELETHWELYGSADDDVYYLLDTIAIATTTYRDTTLVPDYAAGEPAPIEGANTPFPSVKYLLVAFNRLMGFGSYHLAAGASIEARDGVVYFSPPRGNPEEIDVEEVIRVSVDEQGWVDVDEDTAGEDRGLAGPLYGAVFAFKERGIYQLNPTGLPEAPFRVVVLTRASGAVSHTSIVMGEDENGAPALYYLDPFDGPRRLGQRGIEWVGADVADLWATFNVATTVKAAHAVYVQARKQVWFWFATGTSNRPDTCVVFNVALARQDARGVYRGGWQRWTGFLAGDATGGVAAAGCLSSGLMCGPQNTSPRLSLVPVMTINGDLPTIANVGGGAGLDGIFLHAAALIADEVSYPAPTILTKAFGPVTDKARAMFPYVLTDVAAGVTVDVSVVGNTGQGTAVTKTETISLTGEGTATEKVSSCRSLDLAQIWSYQLRLVSAVAKWTLRKLWISEATQDPS